MRRKLGIGVLGLSLAVVALVGCEDKPAVPPAAAPTAVAPAAQPTSAAQASATAAVLAEAKPPAEGAVKFSVDKAQSKVEFMMDAPKEKIRGRAEHGTQGEVHVDPTDLTKLSGTITVDITTLELFQRKAADDGTFNDEKKEDKQNEHARAWLEISSDTPEDVRKKNALVDFTISSIESASVKDLTKVEGAVRKAAIKAKGVFTLHGHKAEKTVELEATFHYDGDKLTHAQIKTTQPFGVDLASHDVRPRDGFGKLAKATLEMVAPKVAKEALVSVDVTVRPAS